MKKVSEQMMSDMKSIGCCKGAKPNYSQTSSKPGDAKKSAMEVMNIGGSAAPKGTGVSGTHGNKSSYVG